MFAGLQGWQLVIIVILVLLLFAAPKLPAMARNLGQSMRIFKSEVKQMKDEDKTRRGASQDADPVEGRIVDEDVRDRDRDARGSGSHRSDLP